MPSSGADRAARAGGADVLGREADDDAGIGVALVARVLAHAVGHHPARLGGRGDDRAARAHAEAVDRAAVLRVVHQLVVGGAEQRMAGVLLAEPGAIDHALRMLDAKADRERLGLHRHAALVQHGEGVAGAVAEGEHDLVGAQLLGACFGACAARDRQAANPAGLDPQVDDARAEADLAAEALDLGAHLLDHADQPEGADVRLGDVGDLLGRAGLDELLDHLAREMARVADLAPELAVGKGAGAALAELDVRFGIEHAAPPQAPGVAGALAHGAAALEDDRAEAHLRQQQGGEESAGPEADDHRPRPPRRRRSRPARWATNR